MLFESNKCVEEQKLELGDIIEFRFSTSARIQRRLVVFADGRYYAIDINNMEQGDSANTLDTLLYSYKNKDSFRIIKSKNLKIVEE